MLKYLLLVIFLAGFLTACSDGDKKAKGVSKLEELQKLQAELNEKYGIDLSEDYRRLDFSDSQQYSKEQLSNIETKLERYLVLAKEVLKIDSQDETTTLEGAEGLEDNREVADSYLIDVETEIDLRTVA